MAVPKMPVSRSRRRLLPWALTLAGALALTTPMLSAGSGATSAIAGARGASGPTVPQSLLDAAAAQPNAMFRVVVQGGRGTRSAAVGDAVTAVKTALPASATKLRRKFSAIDGVAATLSGRQILRLAKWRGISAITPDTTLRSTGYENAEMWRQTSNLQQLSVPPGDWFSPAGAGNRDHRQRHRRDTERRLRLARRRERQRLLTRPRRDGRPAGTRDDGRGHRGRRVRAPSGRRAERAARRRPHGGRERRVARERRDCRHRLDPGAQGAVRHPRRQSVDGRRHADELPLRSARQGGREALVQRDRGRRGCREQRHRDRRGRHVRRARERSVRDHRRRDRPGADLGDRRRLRPAVVLVRPHRRRLREAGAVGSWPLPRDAGAGRVHDRDRTARPRRRSRLHVDVGHVVCGPGRLRRSCPVAGPPPELGRPTRSRVR